jgi:uncharacterized protein (DUF952 family)
VLLHVDADSLGDRLKRDPSRAGALFPHHYLDPALVIKIDALPLGPDGCHTFPPLDG